MQDDPASRLPAQPDRDSDETTITTSNSVARREVDQVALAAGAVLANRYQIEASIGQGGSGTVFRAWDRVLGEPIAVKILHPERAREKSWIKRLAREVKVARAIRHPNVCRVFDLGQADGHWFVTMELAAGGSLRDLLRDAKPRPLAERLDDARALCAGLAAIHAVGITHRDVTPQNLLRMRDGRLVLSDFGLAIESSENTTIHGGTPSYMAPETAMGDRSDQRSDVWQVGLILHEILFGRRPEWDETPDGMVMRWPVPPDASPVEEELARLCRDCLAQNPAARPMTAMAVAGRLAAAEVARPRGRLERAWLRGKAFARRHRRAGMALAVVALAAGTARAVQLVARPPLCRGAEQKVEGIWDMRTKARVRQAFARTGRSYAADTFWTVNRALESYLGGWTAMYTAACEATHVRGEQSAEVLDLRMSCLEDRLSEARAISQVFQNADKNVVANAVDAANALRSVDRCADVVTLRAVVPPPDDAPTRRAVERTRRALAHVKALRDSGRHAQALEEVTALEGEVRGIGYDPLTAEMLAARAWLLDKAGDYGDAERIYDEALAAAEASRHDELAAEVTVQLVGTLGYLGQVGEARRWAALAGALLRRLRGHELLESWLSNNIGLLDEEENRYESALLHFQRAADLKRRVLGADHPDLALSLGNTANVLGKMKRYRESLQVNDQAMAIFGRAYGAENPTVAVHTSNRGEALAGLHRYAEAREAFRRALAIFERELGFDHANLAYPLLGIGNSYLDEGRPGEAIPFLERALAVREKGEPELARVADARFALARALWEARGDRRRAASLATAARETYARLGIRSSETEVAGWLRAHGA
jgi:tetratricopeptide (TPR) repeat protein/tRNA A-37 threonylcarbamoyl transferase component Bud32